MGLVVTGISQDGNIIALEAALKAAGHALDPIQLIGPDDSTQGMASRGLASPGYNLGSGMGSGTGVPGLTSGVPSSGGYGTQFFRNETLSDRLGDLEIPDDEMDNYVEALMAGRHIVAYFAKPDTLDAISEIFRSAGLAKVKVF